MTRDGDPDGTHRQHPAPAEAVARKGADDPSLDALYEETIRDTVQRFEATGSPVVTDGEQRKYHNFWTYSAEADRRARPVGGREPAPRSPSISRSWRCSRTPARSDSIPRDATTAAVDFRHVDLSGIKAAVVDDEADAREIIARILEECGAEVFAAGTADEALATIERVKPHVLVSDIGMPNVDGYELLRLVRALGAARGGGVPAIALTAYARSEDRTRALHAGYLVHVAKPVEPTELVATVASVVGRTGNPIRD